MTKKICHILTEYKRYFDLYSQKQNNKRSLARFVAAWIEESTLAANLAFIFPPPRNDKKKEKQKKDSLFFFFPPFCRIDFLIRLSFSFPFFHSHGMVVIGELGVGEWGWGGGGVWSGRMELEE